MRINGRINAAVVDGLEPDLWGLTDGLGGQSVGLQLAHIAHFRYGWLKSWAPEDLGEAQPAIRKAEDGTLEIIPQDAKALKAIFALGDEAALGAVRRMKASGQSVRDYHDPAMMLARTLAHDANHRGLIMSVLRINGVEHRHIGQAMYGLWGEE